MVPSFYVKWRVQVINLSPDKPLRLQGRHRTWHIRCIATFYNEIFVLHPNQLGFSDIFRFLCQEIGSSNIDIQGDASAAKSQKRYQGRKYIVRWIACGAQDWIFSDRWGWWWNCGNWPGWQEVWWTLATLLVSSVSGKWYSILFLEVTFCFGIFILTVEF